MNRILQVCNTDFYLSKFLLPLVRELVNQGYEVECICSGKNYDPEFNELGVIVHDFEFPQKASPFAFVKSIFEMRKFLKHNKFDCVNSHNRNASIVARLASWFAGVKINLYTAHGYYFHDDQGKVAYKITQWLEALMAYTSDFTMSQSGDDVKIMIENGWVSEHKIKTIGNGINDIKFTPPEDINMVFEKLGFEEKFRIVAIGRMVRGKGFADLINAFAEFQKGKDVELVFVGGNIAKDIDPALEEFKNLIKKHNIEDKIKITGLVDNVQDYLAVSDVFVHPSYREGMPRVVLEAMCMELPVIATNIRGSKEIIEHGVDGLLYEAHDVNELTEKLEYFYSLGESKNLLGKNARQKVLNQYREEQYIARQLSVFKNLMRVGQENNIQKVG